MIEDSLNESQQTQIRAGLDVFPDGVANRVS